VPFAVPQGCPEVMQVAEAIAQKEEKLWKNLESILVATPCY
jgi:hypothetical protein